MPKAKPKNPGGRYTDAAGVEAPLGATVYVKHTTPDGMYITEHRCWDAKRFISSLFKAALETGKGAVEQVAEADYLAWRAANVRR